MPEATHENPNPPSARPSGSAETERRLSDYPRYKLSDQPQYALSQIAAYLRTMRTDRDRMVRDGGQIVGYWQTPEWFDGLWDIASECDRLAMPPNKLICNSKQMHNGWKGPYRRWLQKQASERGKRMATARWARDRERRTVQAQLTAEQYPNRIVRRVIVIDREKEAREVVIFQWDSEREARRKIRKVLRYDSK